MNFEAEVFEQAVKRRPADAEQFRSARQVAAALRQRHLDDAAFRPGPRLAQIERAERQFGRRQLEVGADVAAQLAAGERRIVGVMVESHIHPGRQDLVPGKPLEYGVSITDACLGWEDTVQLLDTLAEGVRKRRVALDAGEE